METRHMVKRITKKSGCIALSLIFLLATCIAIFSIPVSAAGTWTLGTGWTLNGDGSYSFDGSTGINLLRYNPTDAENAWQAYTYSADVEITGESAVSWDDWGPLLTYKDYSKVYDDSRTASSAFSFICPDQGRAYTWVRNVIMVNDTAEHHTDTQVSGYLGTQSAGDKYHVYVYVNKGLKKATYIMTKDGGSSCTWTVDISAVTVNCTSPSVVNDTVDMTPLNTVIGIGTSTSQQLKVSNIAFAEDTTDLSGVTMGANWGYVGNGVFHVGGDNSGKCVFSATDAQKAASYGEMTVDITTNALPWDGDHSRGVGVFGWYIGSNGASSGFNLSVNGIYGDNLAVESKGTAAAYTAGSTVSVKLCVDNVNHKAYFYENGSLVSQGTSNSFTDLTFGFATLHPGSTDFSNIRMTYYNTIDASAGTGGSVSESGSSYAAQGESKTYTITPDANYEISDVKVDGNSVGAVSSYTFNNVNANHTITAEFAAVSATSSATESTTPSTSASATESTTESSTQSTSGSSTKAATDSTTKATTAPTTAESATTITAKTVSNVQTGENSSLLLVLLAVSLSCTMVILSKKHHA